MYKIQCSLKRPFHSVGGGPTILTTEVQVCSTNTFKNIVKLGNLLETYCTMNFIYFFVDVVGISVVCNHL